MLFHIEPLLLVKCAMFLHEVHRVLPLLCFVLLGVNVSQVLIGYVNTTSTQVFVYADGQNNGTVFPGECTKCYPTMCHSCCVSLWKQHIQM